MTKEVFRTKTWDALFLAKFNINFWSSYEAIAAVITYSVRSLLMLGSVFSVVAFMTWKDGERVILALSVITGLISSVIIPGFGLEGFLQKVIGIRKRWIDIRNGLESVWEEIDSSSDIKKLQKDFNRWKDVITELEQFGDWLPKTRKLHDKAYKRTEDALSY